MRIPLLGRLWRRNDRQRPEESAPPAARQASQSVAIRERRLAERLLEDEALRGDLDDATWQPIQDWLLAEAARLATATEGLDDAAAAAVLDRAQVTLRARARERVAELEGRPR